MKPLALALTALVLVTAGCQDPFQPEPPPTLPATAQAVLDDIGSLHFYDPSYASLSQVERDEMKATRRACQRGIVKAVIFAEDLADAHAEVETFFEAGTVEPNRMCRQMAAATILKGHVIPEQSDFSPDNADIVSAYAESMIENGSPEVVTFLQTLEALEREGLNELSHSLAVRSIPYTEQYRDYFVGCTNCGTTPVARAQMGGTAPGSDAAIDGLLQRAQAGPIDL
ncbi:MAG: hypothetical protein AAGI52_07900 [Bacteroidota bacterium]